MLPWHLRCSVSVCKGSLLPGEGHEYPSLNSWLAQRKANTTDTVVTLRGQRPSLRELTLLYSKDNAMSALHNHGFQVHNLQCDDCFHFGKTNAARLWLLAANRGKISGLIFHPRHLTNLIGISQNVLRGLPVYKHRTDYVTV